MHDMQTRIQKAFLRSLLDCPNETGIQAELFAQGDFGQVVDAYVASAFILGYINAIDLAFGALHCRLSSANGQFKASTVPVEHQAVGRDRGDDGFANAIAFVQPVAIEDDEALRGVVIPHVHA